MSKIGLSRAAALATVTLSRIERRNAIDTEMAELLNDALESLAEDDSVRVVAFRGAGGHFCGGADLQERAGMDAQGWHQQHRLLEEVFRRVRALPQPTVAAVEGWALGGGTELALSCDVILADDSARFGLPEVRLGLIPGCGGTQLLPRLVPRAVAARLLFTGDVLDAAEALRLGLVSEKVAAGAVGEALQQFADRVQSNSPAAVRAMKVVLRAGWELPLTAGLECEAEEWHRIVEAPDYAEGLAAFRARRPSNFAEARAQTEEQTEEQTEDEK